jgi:hypothetical protein
LDLYGYVNNGPISAIDPQGLDLEFVGSTAERKSFDAAMKKISDSSSVLKDRIAEMKASSNKHVVQCHTRDSGNYTRNKQGGGVGTTEDHRNTSNGKGTGTLTNWNPSGHDGYSGESVLAHELLGHGYQKDKGVLPTHPVAREIFAIQEAENLYQRGCNEKVRSPSEHPIIKQSMPLP